MHPCGKWGCVVHSFYILLRNNSRTCFIGHKIDIIKIDIDKHEQMFYSK